jgi:hypothetical protein
LGELAAAGNSNKGDDLMTGKITCGWVLGGALLALAATTLAADAKKDAAKGSESATAPDVTDLGTAFQLTEYGRAYNAPEALVTAAGLLLSVARAEMKDLDADLDGKPVVEGTGIDGKPKVLDVELKTADKPDLKKEAAALIDEAELMAVKKKMNLAALVKAVKARGAEAGPAGVVKRFARSVEPGQTHVLKMKATSDEGTDLAFRAASPLLVTVVRVDSNSTLASTLTAGGNVHFKPELGLKTRGVRKVINEKETIRKKGEVIRKKEHEVITRTNPRRHVKSGPKHRGVGAGDCVIQIRIHNPTEEAVPYALFVN